MRLLVTRPAADAQALAAELEARGHSVICAPVIEIVIKPEAAPDLTNVKGLAFTSAMARARFSHSCLLRVTCRPMLSARKRAALVSERFLMSWPAKWYSPLL